MNIQTRRKITRLGVATAAIALIAGAAGGGALTTAQSSITGNKWETTASKPAPDATVTVTGTPFDSKLDKDNSVDMKDWVITNHSTTKAATLSGILTDLAPSANADAVKVAYGYEWSTSLVPMYKWAEGGTLANPKSFTLADLLPKGKNTLDPGQSITLRVKTAFKDPETGVTANDKADFAITYELAN